MIAFAVPSYQKELPPYTTNNFQIFNHLQRIPLLFKFIDIN